VSLEFGEDIRDHLIEVVTRCAGNKVRTGTITICRVLKRECDASM